MPAWLPFVLGGLLVVQFAGLGAWQISRGLEKRSAQEAFGAATGFTTFTSGMQIRPYQRLEATGRYWAGRQFLLDNIIIDNRYGHFVLTPLEVGADEPLLIVNRGWIEKTTETGYAARIGVDTLRLTVRGRAGSLPRAGYRLGDAILPGGDWPQHAVFPTLEDIEAALGQPVQPFVLLMDPEEQHGFLRHWVPAEMGASRHFGYALQWFAMAAVLAGLLVWHYRKRSFGRGRDT